MRDPQDDEARPEESRSTDQGTDDPSGPPAGVGSVGAITELLEGWASGDAGALDALMPLVLKELRRIARRHLAASGSHTLQPTDLVQEAYLRLLRSEGAAFEDRHRFFAFASTVVRSVLVDHARSRSRQRRGGGLQRASLDEFDPGRELDLDTVLAVDQALHQLSTSHPRQGHVAELRLFGGLSMTEIADVVGRSLPTVERDWNLGRRRLARTLSQSS